MNYPDALRHGAKGGVAGSCCHLLMDTQHSLLIDCRLFQGAEPSAEGKSAAERLAIAFPLDTIEALAASHVQVDDGERMPYLLAAGLKGPILCSKSSAKLLPFVLEEAFKFSFVRDQKQIERCIKLIEQCIIALPCKTWFILRDTQCRVRHDFKPFLDNEELQRAGRGNRSSDRRHRRERNMLLRSNRQLTEIHAVRPAVQRFFRRLPGQRRRGPVHLVLWPAGRLCRFGRVRYYIRAQIHTIDGYSANADQKRLVNFVTRKRDCSSEVKMCKVSTARSWLWLDCWSINIRVGLSQ